MSRLHLIQPMGGGGTRFGNKGFDVPKPMIELMGKPFFYWAIRSVTKFIPDADITCVILKEHTEKFGLDKLIRGYFPDARICVIPKVTEGAVITCLEGVGHIEDDGMLLFNDCDHAFVCKSFYEFCHKPCEIDAALLTFDSASPAYSYVKYDESGRITGTVEKKVVSRDAICGAYFFRSRELFEKYAGSYLKSCSYSEYFMSGVYNELAMTGGHITTFSLDKNFSFGTPDEYDAMAGNEELRCLD